MTLREFLESAWRDHADHAEAVAARLPDALPLVERAEDVAPCVRLVTHLFGEHLGRWRDGIDLLERLADSPSAGATAAREAIDLGRATLQLVGGERAPLTSLRDEDCAFALASAADALAARGGIAVALDYLAQARRRVPASIRREHPAVRALAIAGNNISAVLEGRPVLSEDEAHGMLDAAECGLRYWKLAGTWLEEERAEYQLARCALRAGDLATARGSAERCIAVCERNDAPPFERFFGDAVAALAARAAGDVPAFSGHRARALHWHARVAVDERHWCARERGELGD